MAELKAKTRNRSAVLLAVQSKPLAPARVTLGQPQDEGPREPLQTTPPTSEEPNGVADKLPEQKREMSPPIFKEPPSDHENPPSKRSILRARPLLHFIDPKQRKEAEIVAAQRNVSLDQIIRAVAASIEIVADDYASTAPMAKTRIPGSQRVGLTFDGEMASAWIKKHDPNGFQDRTMLLRAVALRAFERAAHSKLAELKNSK